ncbi:MAG: DUF349 domain-containing protein [Gammaproteobacteria bacterium]|nr:DUF349 domain-containing protein [Gammaproteobacteria bacterium]
MISRFLKNLTGPSLEDPDPGRRLHAVERLGPDTPAEDLAEFVRGETDAGVRAACIARIDEAPLLLALMEHEPANGAARSRLAALIDAGLDVPALLTQLDDLALIRHLLDATSREADWRAVLGRIDGEDLLTEVAAHHRSPAVRAAAASRVVHEDSLRQVERIARTRDKDVARSVRERLETLRTARQQAEALIVRLRELATEAAALARSEEEPRLAARMEWLRGQRDAVVGEHADLVAAFAPFEQTPPPLPDELAELDRHLQTVADRIAAAAEAERAEQARLAAEAERRETLAAAAGTMERLATELTERLALSGTPQAEISSLRSALELEEARWRDALGDEPAPPGLAERQAEARARVDRQLAVLDRIRELPEAPEVPAPDPVAPDPPTSPTARVRRAASAPQRRGGRPLWQQREVLRGQLASLDAWLQQVDWPADLERPPVVAGVEARAVELRAAIADIDAIEQRLADRIGKLCGRLERALDAKKLKPAAGMHADLQRQLPILPDTDERRRQRVERIRERLEELRDWEYFATAPKREALCSEMESLAGDPEVAPDQRAAKVKALRADWKALGPLRGDEGRALAARFDAAAEQAFAPARAHFEAASEQRAENTRNRERICDELEQFLDSCDWDAADWKTVDRIYRRARDDWQRFADVDARGRSLGKRYHRLTRTLRGHLEGRWKANIARKEELIEAARALLDESARAGPPPPPPRPSACRPSGRPSTSPTAAPTGTCGRRSGPPAMRCSRDSMPPARPRCRTTRHAGWSSNRRHERWRRRWRSCATGNRVRPNRVRPNRTRAPSTPCPPGRCTPPSMPCAASPSRRRDARRTTPPGAPPAKPWTPSVHCAANSISAGAAPGAGPRWSWIWPWPAATAVWRASWRSLPICPGPGSRRCRHARATARPPRRGASPASTWSSPWGWRARRRTLRCACSARWNDSPRACAARPTTIRPAASTTPSAGCWPVRLPPRPTWSCPGARSGPSRVGRALRRPARDRGSDGGLPLLRRVVHHPGGRQRGAGGGAGSRLRQGLRGLLPADPLLRPVRRGRRSAVPADPHRRGVTPATA